MNGKDSPRDPSGKWNESVDDRAQSLLFECVDRLNSGERVDLDRIAREYPDIGPEVVRQLKLFEGIPEEQQAPLGTLGDYTLRRQIGRGGMGVVYEAWENSMNRTVALKVLPPGIAADSRASARFLREAQTAGKLSHPNVVPVYFTGVKDQTPFSAMEYVEGETLAQVLANIKELDSETGKAREATQGAGSGDGLCLSPRRSHGIARKQSP